MRTIIAISITVSTFTFCGCTAPSTGTSQLSDTADRWQSLFNGRDLAGWTVKCKPRDAGKTFFTVDNGTILADSIGRKDHDYVWLTTNREYADFVLRLRFQAYRDSTGNSGIQLRSRYDDTAGYLDGPQIDINPPGPWRTGMIWDETRGSRRWLYPQVPPGKWVNETMAPHGLIFKYGDKTDKHSDQADKHNDQADSWNTLQIQAVGPHILATLNGITVTDYDGTGTLDDAPHRLHNVGQRGVIALQIHTHDELRIRFTDIQIQEK